MDQLAQLKASRAGREEIDRKVKAFLDKSGVNSQGAKAKDPIKVQSNDNAVVQYDGLLVTMTSDYNWIWSDYGFRGIYDISAWDPVSQKGGQLKPLGSVGVPRHSELSGTRASLLVGADPSWTGPPAVKAPTGFQEIWRDTGSGGKHDGAFWHPIAPSGYVAVGDVATYGYSAPSTSRIWCLRQDLVSEARFVWLWDDERSGARANCSLWDIQPVSAGRHGGTKIPILADCFRARPDWQEPPLSQAKVPALEVGNHFKPFEGQMPPIDPANPPHKGQIFNKLLQVQIELPFVAFFRATDRSCLSNIQKPFCILSRACAWRVEDVINNKGKMAVEDTVEVKKGVSSEQKESFAHSAGVDVSASAGIFGIGFDVSFNYQFTYEQSYSFTEYYEEIKRRDIVTPPRTLKVVFSRHIFFKETRQDESWVLDEVTFNANDELHTADVDIPPDLWD